MSDGTDVLLVLTNVPDAASADRVTQLVPESQVVAYVNHLSECASTYWWNDVLERVTEIPLLIKTTRAAYPQLEATVHRAHPYEVPEIIVVPAVAGLLAHLAWATGETRPASV